MKPFLWLGDEAIAQAAIDAGITGVYAYPGTPSTEITEFIQRSHEARDIGVHAQWCCNEKTAMETALGVSFLGRRALVCMKHVGLNVAADPFINSAITGANGGLVVVVADDPSMHSSQNEQDSRFYGAFAQIPFFEPSNQQEAYDITLRAFELSEHWGVPVLLRLTTRLAHSRADVVRRQEQPLPWAPIEMHEDPRQYVLLPAIARRNYDRLLAKQAEFEQAAEQSSFNHFEEGTDPSIGIIACGIGVNYVREIFRGRKVPYSMLKLSQYPLPRKLLLHLADQCESLMVFEDGYPLVEQALKGILPGSLAVRGRLDGTLPRSGELTPAVVGKALGAAITEAPVPPEAKPRPPQLCAGCPHTNTYQFIMDAVKKFEGSRVFADIGCYTLGALPPFEAIHSCVDMGASITMAKGAADAGMFASLAVIGDSTFAHSGMTGLLDCVEQRSPVTIILVDNQITAMTGGQHSVGCGHLEDIIRGIGVEPDHVHVVSPLPGKHDENTALLQREIEYRGPSVIISRRACIQTAKPKS